MGSKNKAKKLRRKNQREELESNLFESDETFAFIAGYTSGGVPFGITWEERSYCNDEKIEWPFD